VAYPEDLKYTRDHEWVRRDGDHADVGITDYAQAQLGDVVFVELPEVGRALAQGEVFGTIESVKAVSELFSPVSGEVVAVNEAVSSAPETVNSDPHATWLIRLKVADPTEFDALLDAAAYTAHVG
jgi:glycine cleavage system H protein